MMFNNALLSYVECTWPAKLSLVTLVKPNICAHPVSKHVLLAISAKRAELTTILFHNSSSFSVMADTAHCVLCV